jgi:hypothetical protein
VMMGPSIRHGYRQAGWQADRPTFWAQIQLLMKTSYAIYKIPTLITRSLT